MNDNINNQEQKLKDIEKLADTNFIKSEEEAKKASLDVANVPTFTKEVIEDFSKKNLLNKKKRTSRIPEKTLDLSQKIRNLFFVRRLSRKEIADLLNITPVSVSRYLMRIRKAYKRAAGFNIDLLRDLNQFYAELQTRYDERIKRLWHEYAISTSPKLKLAILKEIREQEKQHIEILQEVGIIKKEPENLNIRAGVVTQEIPEDYKNLSIIEMKEKIKELIDEADENTAKIIDAEIKKDA